MFGGKKRAYIHTDGTASFLRMTKVTNYVTFFYGYTEKFSRYIEGFTSRAAKYAKHTGADELNGAYLDVEIDAECALMKSEALKQRASHLSLINHNCHVYSEDLSCLLSEKAQLESDLAETAREIEELKAKKKAREKKEEERKNA